MSNETTAPPSVAEVRETSAERVGEVAMALPGWRWMPRMQSCGGGGACVGVDVSTGDTGFLVRSRVRWVRTADAAHGWLVDVDDPATAGCLESIGYTAGWLIGMSCDQRLSGAAFTARYVGADGRTCTTIMQSSPGRAVALAALARDGWA